MDDTSGGTVIASLRRLRARYRQAVFGALSAIESVPAALTAHVPIAAALDRFLTAGLCDCAAGPSASDGAAGARGGGGGHRAPSAGDLQNVRLVSVLSVVLVVSQAYRAVRIVRKQWRRSSRRKGMFAWSAAAGVRTDPSEVLADETEVALSPVRAPEASPTTTTTTTAVTAANGDDDDETPASSAELGEVHEDAEVVLVEVLNRYWRQVRRAILLAPRSPSPLQPFPPQQPYAPPPNHKAGPVLLRPRAEGHDASSSSSSPTVTITRGEGHVGAAEVIDPVFCLPIPGSFIYTHSPDASTMTPSRLFFEDPLGGRLASMDFSRQAGTMATSLADLSELAQDRPGPHEATGRFSTNPDDPRTFWEALYLSWVGCVQYPVSFREMRKLLLSTAPSAFLTFVNTETTYGPTVKDVTCANMALLWYVECLRRIFQSLVVYRDIERCEEEVEELRKYGPALHRLCIARWPKPAEMKPISERVLATYNIFVMCSPQGAWQTLECAHAELIALRRRMNFESLFSLGRYLYASSGSKRVSTALIAMLTALSTKVHSVGRLVRERIHRAVNDHTTPRGRDGEDRGVAASTTTTTSTLWALVTFELARLMLNYTIAQTSSEFIALTAARRHEAVRAQLLEAFAHMPMSYFDRHTSDEIESILYYVDDMEGLDVQLNQFAFNAINAFMAVAETLLVLNRQGFVVVGVSVAFPRLLKRAAKLVQSRYRNLEQVGALPWLVAQSDSELDEAVSGEEEAAEADHKEPDRTLEMDGTTTCAEVNTGTRALYAVTTTTTTPQQEAPDTSATRRVPSPAPPPRLHRQKPGMMLWGTPLPPLRQRGGASDGVASAAHDDPDDDDFVREGFLLRGEEIVYAVAQLRPYGADTRLVHWWNRYMELQNRAKTPGASAGTAAAEAADKNGEEESKLRAAWRYVVATVRELSWLPYGKVIPGLGTALVEVLDWLLPVLITNYGVVWSRLAEHLTATTSSLPPTSDDYASALFALSDAVDAVDRAADVVAEGIDMVSVVLANAYKASVLEKLLSPDGWEQYSRQEVQYLTQSGTAVPVVPVVVPVAPVLTPTLNSEVDLRDARLYRGYTIAEVRLDHLQCQYRMDGTGAVAASLSTGAAGGGSDAVFRTPLSTTLHLYPGPTPIRCPQATSMRGCFVCITGPNGTGKSTLAHALLGLTRAGEAGGGGEGGGGGGHPVTLSFVRYARWGGCEAAAGGLRTSNQVLSPSFLNLAAMGRHASQYHHPHQHSKEDVPSTASPRPERPAGFEVPLSSVPADVLRRRLFSYVPEMPILFNGATVAHNISLAGYVSLATEEILTRARICASAARCTFVESLPMGLLTKVTDGSSTAASGGGGGDGVVRLTPEQQQLLMIARALYHGGDVLLMDEPTRRAEPATVRGLRDLWREMLATGIVKGIICFTSEPCLLEMADQVVSLEHHKDEDDDDVGEL